MHSGRGAERGERDLWDPRKAMVRSTTCSGLQSLGADGEMGDLGECVGAHGQGVKGHKAWGGWGRAEFKLESEGGWGREGGGRAWGLSGTLRRKARISCRAACANRRAREYDR